MLFSSKNKKEEKSTEKVSRTASDAPAHYELSIKILGSGCPKCNRLEQAALAALEELKMDAKVDHVTEFKDIAAYGVMSTPALVINEEVVSSGQVLSVNQIVKLINQKVN